MNIDVLRINKIGKKKIGYERLRILKGKNEADTCLHFWIEGYKSAQKELTNK